MSEEAKYCEKCKRMKGVGCACEMTFAEKMKTVQIDRQSLKHYVPGRRGEM